jgi:SAM-dependent methyltransferase
VATGLDVTVGTLADLAVDPKFDAIFYVHVLEHVVDPRRELEEAHRHLRAGGRLVIAVPNAAGWERGVFGSYWDGWDVPRHIHHFTPESLCGLLRSTGFAPDRVMYEPYALIARSLRNRRRDARTAPRAPRASRVIDRGVGSVLALFGRSSAMQVSATRV